MLDTCTTLPGDPIRAPGNPAHLMWVKPFARTVTVERKGQKLAETYHPLLVVELGRDLYHPVLYIPRKDVVAELAENMERTFCPLKGHASYFNLIGPGGAPVAQDIAWGYEDALPSATILQGHLAFDTGQVTLIQSPI